MEVHPGRQMLKKPWQEEHESEDSLTTCDNVYTLVILALVRGRSMDPWGSLPSQFSYWKAPGQ